LEKLKQIISVLHVDDDSDKLEFTKFFLENEGNMDVTSITSPVKALELVKIKHIDCIVSDFFMPEMNGIEFAKKIRESSNMPIILYTGNGSEEVAEAAFAVGVDDYLRKDYDPSHYQVLAKRIKSLVEKKLVEEGYREFFERASEAIWIHDYEGIILDVNETACRRLGYKKSELLNKQLKKIATSISDTKFAEYITKLKDGAEIVFESYNFTKNGNLIPVEVCARAIKYNGIDAILSFSRDISERKKREDQVKTRLNALNLHASKLDELSSIDEVAKCSFEIIESLLGFSDGAIGIADGDLLKFIYAKNIHHSKLPKLPLSGKGITVRAIRTGTTQLVNDTRRDPDFQIGYGASFSELDVPIIVHGKAVAVINLEDSRTNAFNDEHRTVLEILSRSIGSALSRIEQLETIKASEAKYMKLLDLTPEPAIIASGTTIIYVNDKMIKMLGYDDASNLIGKDMSMTLPEGERERILNRTLSRQKAEFQPNTYELKLLKKNGEIIEAEVVVSPIEFEKKPAILAFTRNISERKIFERRLQALHSNSIGLSQASTQKEVCELTLDAVEAIIGFQIATFLIVEDDHLTAIGSRGMEPLGKPLPLDGQGITVKAAREKRSILVNDVRNNLDFIKGSADSLSELAVPILVDGEVMAVLNVENVELNAFNETDQKLVETLSMHVSSAFNRLKEIEEIKIREAVKAKDVMDVANRVSSMVRHDIRGPLQTIQSASYLLRRKPDRAEELTSKIDESVDYAVRILDDLKASMQLPELKRTKTDIGLLIEKSVTTINIPINIQVEKRINAFSSIEADSYQIQRVVDNLIRNAVQAMPKGGSLVIDVESFNDELSVEVEDSGPGIPPEVAKNLFKPFKTTKEGGTGLGLYICKQIIEAHGGSISYYTIEGKGTSFKVILPIKSPKSVTEAEKQSEERQQYAKMTHF
jgi:PAS domain S-box-containing protein